MESTEKAELGKETKVLGELAKESTPSQTSRVIRFPASLLISSNWESSKDLSRVDCYFRKLYVTETDDKEAHE